MLAETFHIAVAQPADQEAWLELAREVEPLFGPMVSDAGFHRALENNIARGTAYCIRVEDGAPGSLLAGGLLFSPKPPTYKIGWLAVSQNYRGKRLGTRLVAHIIQLVQPPAELVVTTFGADVVEGQPARHLYTRMGLTPAEHAPNGPEGGSRQVFRRTFK